MVCDGHCGVECWRSGCKNLFIDQGKFGCLGRLEGSSFRASVNKGSPSLNAPEQSLQQQFDEIYKLINQYRQLSLQMRQAKIDGLVARIKAVIASMKEQMREDQKEAAIAARRRELIMRHPWGYMSDLGYQFSMRSLEQMAKTQEPSEFSSYQELVDYFNHPHSSSLLANSQRFNAFRLAGNEQHHG
jgi:hypothetical protein